MEESSSACGQNRSKFHRSGARTGWCRHSGWLPLPRCRAVVRYDPVQVPVRCCKVAVGRHSIEHDDSSQGPIPCPHLPARTYSAPVPVRSVVRRSSWRMPDMFLCYSLAQRAPASRETAARWDFAPARAPLRNDSRAASRFPRRSSSSPMRPDRTDTGRGVRDRRSPEAPRSRVAAPSRCPTAIARLSATTGEGAMRHQAVVERDDQRPVGLVHGRRAGVRGRDRRLEVVRGDARVPRPSVPGVRGLARRARRPSAIGPDRGAVRSPAASRRAGSRAACRHISDASASVSGEAAGGYSRSSAVNRIASVHSSARTADSPDAP